MRPKDHAIIIFERFLLASKVDDDIVGDERIAKKCSIIHAQDMFDQAKAWGVVSVHGYWTEVIEEIGKIRVN